ncbi:hypothetical protein ACNKHP_06900 [Shigella boydii]
MTRDNLLHNIQSDILELENRAVAGVNIEEGSRSDNKRPLDPLDSSITFHVCHSPQREVEVFPPSPAGDAERKTRHFSARHHRDGG